MTTSDAAGDGDELAATWVVEGEVDVTINGRTIRVLVPAGVGVPGLSDTDLALELVRLLRVHDEPLPDVIDVAMVAARRPQLLSELEADLDG